MQIRDILTDHELPWSVDQLVSRARQVIAQGGTTLWWLGQGGSMTPPAEQERMRLSWTSCARTKLSCQKGAARIIVMESAIWS
jgi:hypothetical protein